MSRGLGGGLSMILNHHLFFVCVVVGSMSLSHPNVSFSFYMCGGCKGTILYFYFYLLIGKSPMWRVD